VRGLGVAFLSCLLSASYSLFALTKYVDVQEGGTCSENVQEKLARKIRLFYQNGYYVIAFKNCGDIVAIFPSKETRNYYLDYTYSIYNKKCETNFFYIDSSGLSGLGVAKFTVLFIENPNKPAIKCTVKIDEANRQSSGKKLELSIY